MQIFFGRKIDPDFSYLNKIIYLKTDNAQNLSCGSHKIFENASSKLHLTESKVAGKHFVAAQPINTGDTLLIEDPYVRCLSPEKYNSHCHNCLSR